VTRALISKPNSINAIHFTCFPYFGHSCSGTIQCAIEHPYAKDPKMNAKSIKGASLSEIKGNLNKCIDDGFKPTLSFVFSSVKQDFSTITEVLGKEDITVFGATTSGEFIDGDVEEGSAAILLLDMNPDLFKVLFVDAGAPNTREIARQMGDTALESFSNPLFIVSGTGLTIDGELIVRGLEDAAGEDTTIYGGLAGDDLQQKATFVFTNGKESSNGIMVLAIDGDKVEIKGRSTCGWKPTGTVKTVTKAEGWWIHTIDDQPALDLVIRYMGVESNPKDDIELVAPDFGVNFPLQLQRKEGAPIMRPVMFFNWKDHSIMVNGSVEEGAKIRLSVPPDFEVIEKVIEGAEDVKANEFPEAEALVMFSCIGRHVALGPLVGREIEGVRNTFDVPMAGFFSYGEFGRATNGHHEYHNLTCCWLAMKEK